MSLLQRVRDSFARPINSGYQTYTFRIDQQVAYHLVPMIERMADGDNDAWALINAVRFHFADQRPIIALHRGEEGSYHDRCRDGDRARGDPAGFYDGIIVRHAGRELVMAGPPATFVAGEEAQLSLF